MSYKFIKTPINLVVILALAIIIPTSCKKDPIEYTFKGHLTDLQSGNNVEGVAVKISQIVFNSTSTNSNYSTVANLSSDLNGDYSATFLREKVSDFKIELSKTGYFYHESIINPSDVSTENENIFDYVMEPKAWIKFQFVNLAPQNFDELTLILQNFKLGCSECIPNDYLYFSGAVDTTLLFTTTAGAYAKFIYIDEWTSNSTTDSIYMIPFDTVTYSFNY